jgi:RsiW-degrading membrane proteinase PrsW (M82 family)
MEPSSYPPPPPPSTSPNASKRSSGFHGPATNLFPGIRQQLTSLETGSRLPGAKTPTMGLLCALIISATAGLGLSIVVQLPILAVAGFIPVTVFFAPLTEEPIKALGMLIVLFLLWKILPNRRYGAALGAAAGFGFGVAESILYIAQWAAAGSAEGVAMRIIVTPLMHPLWSAFVGLGVFALFSNGPTQFGMPKQRNWNLALFLFGLGFFNHLIWNSVAIGLSIAGLGILSTLPDIFIIFPIFALILRDILGGHFNFWNFFESTEITPQFPSVPPLPPPPPPP